MTITRMKRVATYERVSSEDQRERETIKTQTDALAERLAHDPTAQLVAQFRDDGADNGYSRRSFTFFLLL